MFHSLLVLIWNLVLPQATAPAKARDQGEHLGEKLGLWGEGLPRAQLFVSLMSSLFTVQHLVGQCKLDGPCPLSAAVTFQKRFGSGTYLT